MSLSDEVGADVQQRGSIPTPTGGGYNPARVGGPLFLKAVLSAITPHRESCS